MCFLGKQFLAKLEAQSKSASKVLLDMEEQIVEEGIEVQQDFRKTVRSLDVSKTLIGHPTKLGDLDVLLLLKAAKNNRLPSGIDKRKCASPVPLVRNAFFSPMFHVAKGEQRSEDPLHGVAVRYQGYAKATIWWDEQDPRWGIVARRMQHQSRMKQKSPISEIRMTLRSALFFRIFEGYSYVLIFRSNQNMDLDRSQMDDYVVRDAGKLVQIWPTARNYPKRSKKKLEPKRENFAPIMKKEPQPSPPPPPLASVTTKAENTASSIGGQELSVEPVTPLLPIATRKRKQEEEYGKHNHKKFRQTSLGPILEKEDLLDPSIFAPLPLGPNGTFDFDTMSPGSSTNSATSAEPLADDDFTDFDLPVISENTSTTFDGVNLAEDHGGKQLALHIFETIRKGLEKPEFERVRKTLSDVLFESPSLRHKLREHLVNKDLRLSREFMVPKFIDFAPDQKKGFILSRENKPFSGEFVLTSMDNEARNLLGCDPMGHINIFEEMCTSKLATVMSKFYSAEAKRNGCCPEWFHQIITRGDGTRIVIRFQVLITPTIGGSRQSVINFQDVTDLFPVLFDTLP